MPRSDNIFVYMAWSVFYKPLLARAQYQTKSTYTIGRVDVIGEAADPLTGPVMGIGHENVPRDKLQFGKPALMPHIQAE